MLKKTMARLNGEAVISSDTGIIAALIASVALRDRFIEEPRRIRKLDSQPPIKLPAPAKA